MIKQGKYRAVYFVKLRPDSRSKKGNYMGVYADTLKDLYSKCMLVERKHKHLGLTFKIYKWARNTTDAFSSYKFHSYYMVVREARL